MVKPHLLQVHIPDAILLSLRLEQDGHSFFALRMRWTFE
jgi:hypothetical protein